MRNPNIDAIRRRAEAATPGTWKTGDKFGSGSLGSSVVAISGKLPPLELDSRRNGRADASFIAHARQDIPALLDQLSTALAIIDDLVDPDPCWYDHGGKCQAHGSGGNQRCADARAREFISQHGMSTGSTLTSGSEQ